MQFHSKVFLEFGVKLPFNISLMTSRMVVIYLIRVYVEDHRN